MTQQDAYTRSLLASEDAGANNPWSWDQPPQQQPADDYSQPFPVYRMKPGRWDVNDPANVQVGETQENYRWRATMAARHWAKEDEDELVAEREAQARAETKRQRNREAQAAFRERQRANAPPSPRTDPVVIQKRQELAEATAQRAAALAQWDQYIATKKAELAAATAAAIVKLNSNT